MFSATIFGAELYYVLWFFFLFSFLGVIVEMVFCYAQEGVIESRLGVLYLPFSPIYGCGGVVLSLYLRRFIEDPLLMFVAGIIVGTILEYVVSFLMEKAFHTVFWDYSDKPLNLHGRVCLQYAVYWGLLSLLLLYVIDKYAYAVVNLFPRDVGDAILVVCVVLFVLSEALTMASFTRLRHKVAALRDPDGSPLSTDPVAGLVDQLVPDPVLINTFPRMSLVLEYMALTGLQRKWIRVKLHLGQPSAIHRRMRYQAAEAAEPAQKVGR